MTSAFRAGDSITMFHLTFTRSFVGAAAPMALLLGACASTPAHTDDVVEILDRKVRTDDRERGLTGVWLDDEGERVLLVQSGNLVGVMPLGDSTRNGLHFGEGLIEGVKLDLIAYRQGVTTEASVAGLDVARMDGAALGSDGQSIQLADGRGWRRVESVPGIGDLTGVWRTASGERVAMAHEANRLLACGLDPAIRERFEVVHARVADDGKLWAIFVSDGRPAKRAIGVPGADRTSIDWSNGGRWQLDDLLFGGPPGPPRLVAPVAGEVVPNAVDGELRWAFDWDDVAGASEYRFEVIQEDARRPFVSLEGVLESEYLNVRSGGFLSRVDGWSWRVAAKVGDEWTNWSDRALFRVNDQ
ncbi:MAG: hypothetical protein ACJAQ3_002199 [Planctomycetota bacterium]|jgi:hypothetical protein